MTRKGTLNESSWVILITHGVILILLMEVFFKLLFVLFVFVWTCYIDISAVAVASKSSEATIFQEQRNDTWV